MSPKEKICRLEIQISKLFEIVSSKFNLHEENEDVEEYNKIMDLSFASRYLSDIPWAEDLVFNEGKISHYTSMIYVTGPMSLNKNIILSKNGTWDEGVDVKKLEFIWSNNEAHPLYHFDVDNKTWFSHPYKDNDDEYMKKRKDDARRQINLIRDSLLKAGEPQ